MHMEAQSSLHISPKLFNGIQIRGKSRQEDDPKAIVVSDIINGVFAMERCIVQNQYALLRVLKLGNKNMFKPTLKQIAVH